MITCQHICKLIMKSKETLEASGKPWKTLPLHQHLSTICLSTYFLTFKPNSLSSNNLDFLVLILILVCGKKNWPLCYGEKCENHPKMVSKLLTIKPKHILKLVFWIISPGAQRPFFYFKSRFINKRYIHLKDIFYLMAEVNLEFFKSGWLVTSVKGAEDAHLWKFSARLQDFRSLQVSQQQTPSLVSFV